MIAPDLPAEESEIESSRPRSFPLPPVRFLVPAGLAAVYFWLSFASTAAGVGHIGPNYGGIATDWMVFHGAARSYFSGHVNGIFDGDGFTDFLNRSYGYWLTAKLPFRPWVYPPSYLLLILPFGLLSLIVSFVLFQLATAGALAGAIVGALDLDKASGRTIAAAAILSPAAAANAVVGQNAFLVAAILIAGVGLLERRPVVAGLILGLVSIKPQFAILLPFALIASREWKPLAMAAASVIGVAILSMLVFGWESWILWFQQTWTSLSSPNPRWIEFGRMWGNSIWTCAILLGFPRAAASALQLAGVIVGIVFVFIAFRRTHDPLARLSVLLPATLLAAPHWSPYDAILLAVGGLLWIAKLRGKVVTSQAWIVVLLLWLVPVFSPVIVIPFSRLLIPLLILSTLFLTLPARSAVTTKGDPGPGGPERASAT